MMSEIWMRFILLLIPKGYKSIDADAVPGAVASRMAYNKTLHKAGVLLGLDALLPPSTGARISFIDGKASVTEGPFAEASENIEGYWIIQVRSREEAIEWARRAPMTNNEIIEVRQIYEIGDCSIDAQKAPQGFNNLPDAAARKA
jgi:hypothetical protein